MNATEVETKAKPSPRTASAEPLVRRMPTLLW
jgi:hypothetical protein